MSEKVLGTIKVAEIVDNPDGTCTVHFDVSSEMQELIMETMGWSSWQPEEFNKFVENSLEYYANIIATKTGKTKEAGE